MHNTKIITCTGFYGTGSSAITDFFSDFESVGCKGDYEVRFLHDPYGVSDLEYNLIDNPNRHNTSNAIKKYRWIVNFLSGTKLVKRYEGYFNGQFKLLSYQYIDDITEFKYKGKWHYDIIEKGIFAYVINRTYNKFFEIIKRIFHIKNEVGHDLLSRNEMAFAGISDRKKFYEATQKYTGGLADVLNSEKREYILLDQLVPPSNFVRYNNYVNNMKIIVVDRDPRDIFLCEKKVWKGTVVPYYDIDKFCKWYKWTRSMYERSEKPDNVLKIQFEDLIYKFDDTAKKLTDFVGVDKKDYMQKHFVPSKSAKNTQLWKKYSEEKKMIKIIETRLAEYCYDYSHLEDFI